MSFSGWGVREGPRDLGFLGVLQSHVFVQKEGRRKFSDPATNFVFHKSVTHGSLTDGPKPPRPREKGVRFDGLLLGSSVDL